MLDASYYPSDIRIPGIEDTTESYDALNSALAVNFNTIARRAQRHQTVRSAESQTPITPLAIREFRARGPSGRGRISLSKDPAVSLQYAGELIAAFIERAGGSVKGKISTGAVPEGLKPVYVHRQSRTLSQILVRAAHRLEQLHRQPGLPGDRRASPRAGPSASRSRSRSRTRCSPSTASPRPSISRKARASAAATASRPAASPRCSHLFAPHADLLRGHDGALEQDRHHVRRPHARRAMPTPQATGACAS